MFTIIQTIFVSIFRLKWTIHSIYWRSTWIWKKKKKAYFLDINLNNFQIYFLSTLKNKIFRLMPAQYFAQCWRNIIKTSSTSMFFPAPLINRSMWIPQRINSIVGKHVLVLCRGQNGDKVWISKKKVGWILTFF